MRRSPFLPLVWIMACLVPQLNAQVTGHGTPAAPSAQKQEPAGPAFLVGQTQFHHGARLHKSVRFAAMYPLVRKAESVWELELEYYSASAGSTLRIVNPDGAVVRVRADERARSLALGFGYNRRLGAASVGGGISAQYYRFAGTGDVTVEKRFDSGAGSIELAGSEPQERVFAPGAYLHSELYLAVLPAAGFFLRQKLQMTYIGSQADATFADSWLSYTIYGGVRLAR